jgi:hypothetical protein
MAAAQTLPDPGAAWSGELRKRGVLGESTPLPPSEQAAADLLDALHPEGIQGAIQQAAALMADPARTARLGPLLGRLEALRDDAGDDVVEALAAEWAAVLPTGSKLPPAVDVDTMDALLGHRLSPAKRRCLRRIRELVEAPGR